MTSTRVWTIYGTAASGWFAWNARTTRRVDLTSKGTFSFGSAVADFERRFRRNYYTGAPIALATKTSKSKEEAR